MLKENETVTFDMLVENATPCNYELGLLTNTTNVQNSLFITDDLGRNNTVNLEDPNYVFLDIKKYKINETLFDWKTQKK